MGPLSLSGYKKLLLSIMSILLMIGIIGGYEMLIFLKYPLVVKTIKPQALSLLEIKPGMSLRTITKKLYQTPGVRKAPMFSFERFVQYYHRDNQLKAGDYVLEPGITPQKLLEKMVSGKGVRYAFTIIEGWTLSDLVYHLKQDPNLTHDLQMPIKAEPQSEGLFFPDTYYFSKGTTDLKFLNKAFLALQKHLTAEWKKRDPTILLKTPYEALILASIIEKETAVNGERPWVSSVFHERLKKKMRLQADPTVIYGVGAAYKGKINLAMLRKDTPYNTYVRQGLPPSPIALPGLASIQAALHPKKCLTSEPYLYFVAKGDGSHYFSKTLAEHNAAVHYYILNKHASK